MDIKELKKRLPEDYKNDYCPKCKGTLAEGTIKTESGRLEEIYICLDCDYNAPKCDIYSRVVGYLSPLKNWNQGKMSEYNQRKEYKVGE